jgi:hypothetical protein
MIIMRGPGMINANEFIVGSGMSIVIESGGIL